MTEHVLFPRSVRPQPTKKLFDIAESLPISLSSGAAEHCARWPPLSVLFYKHPQNLRLRSHGEIAVGIDGFENSEVRRKRNIPVHGHQLEIPRIGSDAGNSFGIQ